MTDSWDDHADGWDGNSAVNLYASQAFASLAARVDIADPSWKSKRVLDFGCGTGLLAGKIARHVHELVAVDSSEKMIAVLKGKNLRNVVAVHGDILDDGYRFDGNLLPRFDLIYASSVCGFLPDYENAVTTLTRMLKPGGHFVQWDWQASDDEGGGLSDNRIKTALEKAQLGAVQVGPAFTIMAENTAMPVVMGAGTL